MGALDGIRVIDFGQYIAGPLAAVMLADEGADVIHIDPPTGPSWKSDADAFFNRGKRRISLDLKSAKGLQDAQRLVDGADVVIENFRPGVMQRLGLGAEALTERNPGLIYCTLPGFAPDDPRASMRAWEGVLDAATENCFGRVGEPPEDWDMTRPTYSALPLASNFGGFLGATGVVMALIARERTGKGQTVEVPLFDAMFTLIGHSGAYVNTKGLHAPGGIHGRGAGAFRCGDGKYVQFDTSSARHLTWFAQEAGITEKWGPELLDLKRNANPEVNKQLHAALRELFLTRSAAEWEDVGLRSGAAMGWCRNTDEWIASEHARAIQAVVELDDPELGPTWMSGLPVRLTETPGAPQGPRHLPDADHAAVLSELDRLPARRVITPVEPGVATPLDGMKVLDLCLALAGPTCGRLLSEFGATVTKINAPHSRGMSGYLSRGKRQLLIDLEPTEAHEVFWGMAKDTDVILENFSPGTADRLGIGYHEARSRKADIVYTSISCYGYGGPMTHGRGWERQGQAVAGIMERTGSIPAILGPYNLIDIGTGVMGTFATALGLYHRQRTGQGQHVQASLCQTATYQQAPYMLSYKGHESTEPRGYEALGTGPLNRFYQASDVWFFLAAREQDRRALDGVTGLQAAQGLEGNELHRTLEACFSGEPAKVWVERLVTAEISAHVILPVADLMVDPYVRKRGLSVTMEVEGAGEVIMPGLSVRMSGTPLRLGNAPKPAGSDAEAILSEIGLAELLPKLEKAWVLQTKDLPAAW